MPLQSRLPQIAATLEAITRGVVAEDAEHVVRAARRNVPKKTWALHDAIHTQTDKTGTYVVAGDNDAFYGHMVEFGTRRAAPRPFLVPALEQNRADIVADVAAAVRQL